MTPEDLLAEARCYGRPDNFGGDAMCYGTHWPFFGWARNGDDLLAESNYFAALGVLQAAEDSGHSDGTPDVVDADCRHWAVGPLSQIWVRALTDDGDFTEAWLVAAELVTDYQSYPVLDEDDYSERQWVEFQRQMGDAIGDARDDDLESILPPEARATVTERTYRLYLDIGCAFPDVDYDRVSEVYGDILDTVLTEYGESIMDANRQAERDLYDTDILELAGT